MSSLVLQSTVFVGWLCSLGYLSRLSRCVRLRASLATLLPWLTFRSLAELRWCSVLLLTSRVGSLTGQRLRLRTC